MGVKWEGVILTQEFYDAEAYNHKFIPVLFSSRDAAYIPTVLRGGTSYRVNTPEGYETLYRHLTHQPNVLKPPLGSKRLMPAYNRQQEPLSGHDLQAQAAHSAGQLIIKLNATFNDINQLEKLQAIIARLRELSGDIDLKLHRIDHGSVILVLEGSQKGFERLASLFENGQLTHVLGIEIQDIRPEAQGALEQSAAVTTTVFIPVEETSAIPWHVLYTRSHCEQLVYEQLVARGFEVFLPKIETMTPRGGYRHYIPTPMFPNYLFLHHALDEISYLELRKTRGLIRILGENLDQLSVIPHAEIPLLKTALQARVPIIPYPYMNEGARV